MTFHKMIEDPMYDEDGNCVDEDFDWEDAAIQEFEDLEYAAELENFDPFDTVNS